MNALIIRDREPTDLPGCVGLLAEVHRHDGYPLNWPADPYRWLHPPELCHAWVAEADAAGLVGHLAVHLTNGDPDQPDHADQDSTGQDSTGPDRAGPDRAGPERAEVARLFVSPAFRRRQVAIGLLRAARRWATDRRMDLTLEVVDRQRSPAVALYERDGWRHAATVTADWTAPDGAPVTLRRYLASADPPRRA
ncbi:GNAT family N-acetyltransferase [Micromonospora sp. WMMD1082]|uniref:GNAT family N-acetyltransferase n=1 Tax=Micromonospora sp. WMMD1082 TaxID=3016104 RepID=UPI002415E600|nr:GNAT family N-acetyltransferase [Micromonospora sp. WMMD1082]MDG4798167.1 GNAT family N-acetyltransferase [Micromonospora sp. WMMD1082]